MIETYKKKKKGEILCFAFPSSPTSANDKPPDPYCRERKVVIRYQWLPKAYRTRVFLTHCTVIHRLLETWVADIAVAYNRVLKMAIRQKESNVGGAMCGFH